MATTIRMVDPAMVAGRTREIFEAVLRREQKVFGATSVSNIWTPGRGGPRVLFAEATR
jgi:hypothetical protein